MNVGTRVIATIPCDGKTSIQYESGRVLYVGRRVLVEFDTNICGHNGNGLGKKRKCWMVDLDKLKEEELNVGRKIR